MLTYRAQKGAPLTSEEMDGNFRDLENRLKILETHLATQEGIGKILIEDDKIIVLGTLGTEFGKFPLPKPSVVASSLSIPLYEKATLPPQNPAGQLALLFEEDGPTLIFFEGTRWQRVRRGDPV